MTVKLTDSDGISCFRELPCDVVECRNKPEWLERRRPWMHASDGASIIAENRGYYVYSEKVSPPLVPHEEEWQTIKLEMEAPVRRLYRRKYGGRVFTLPPYTICVSKAHPWLRCTPDGLVEDPERDGLGLMQIKCWSEHDKRSWDEEPPEYVQVQVQLELAASGCKWGVIVVMFGSQSMKRFIVEPNERFMQTAVPFLKQWHRDLEARKPPPVDGSVQTSKALDRLHPFDNGLAVCLPEEFNDDLDRLARITALMGKLKKVKRGIENKVKAALGPHTYGVTYDDQWIKWGTQERAEHIVPATSFRMLRFTKPPKQIVFSDEAPETFRVTRRVKLPLALKLRLLRQYPRCRWCGRQLTLHTASFEHVVPLGVGGTNDYHNIDLACVGCNEERADNAHLLESKRR